MQAQDFFGALWAVGLRLSDGALADVEAAFRDGALLRTHLRLNYDEYGAAYKDLGAGVGGSNRGKLFDYSFAHSIVIDGQITGSRRREIKKNEIVVEGEPQETFSPADRELIAQAAGQYQKFLSRQVKLLYGPGD